MCKSCVGYVVMTCIGIYTYRPKYSIINGKYTYHLKLLRNNGKRNFELVSMLTIDFFSLIL
jgi:hypothetical protein